MNETNVLLIGGGGREHALADAIARSPRLGSFWVTHGSNPGLASLGKQVDVPVDIKEIYRLRQFCDREKISLVVIGPEDPLAQGYADELRAPGRAVFGPGAAGARLEADKAWAKQLMRAASIPTAEGRVFEDPDVAEAFYTTRDEPQVIKAAGLAKGKGVIIPATEEDGIRAIRQIMTERIFGDAGAQLVIEERLDGVEASVLALVDGRSVLVLPPCQDHKRLGDGDAGPNTGGMGAFCPTSTIDDEQMERIEREVLVPVVDSLRREEIDFTGVLYAGLMLTHAGPKVLEFNVRFGDPECQPLMARLESDVIDLMIATATGGLHEVDVRWSDQAATCIVLAAEGYPGKPVTGTPIRGIDEAAAMEGIKVYHAGTKRRGDEIVTAGGRVLSVTALGDDMSQARDRAYAACDRIQFDGMQLRRDIGA